MGHSNIVGGIKTMNSGDDGDESELGQKTFIANTVMDSRQSNNAGIAVVGSVN